MTFIVNDLDLEVDLDNCTHTWDRPDDLDDATCVDCGIDYAEWSTPEPGGTS